MSKNINHWAIVYQSLLLSEKSYSKWVYKRNSNSFLVKSKGEFTFIAFTGSSEVNDWFHNFEAFKVERDDAGKVHNGFADGWDDLKDMVKSEIEGDKKRKLIVTGHSLGGALAILCAYFLKREGYNVVECITFGQPRVGNWEFMKSYEKLKIPTIRFVHGYDIVPTIPRLLYFHVGQVVPIFDGKILEKQMGFGLNLVKRFTEVNRFLHHKLVGTDNCYKTCIDRILKSFPGVKSSDLNFKHSDFSLT